jgi:hypothetical protein
MDTPGRELSPSYRFDWRCDEPKGKLRLACITSVTSPMAFPLYRVQRENARYQFHPIYASSLTFHYNFMADFRSPVATSSSLYEVGSNKINDGRHNDTTEMKD